jgi:hypothetical protein
LFKAIRQEQFVRALDKWPWIRVYNDRDLADVDTLTSFITAGIDAALDIVAPLREIRVKSGKDL